MAKDEREILLREKHNQENQQCHGPEVPSTSSYRVAAPMTYMDPRSPKVVSTKGATPVGKNIVHDKKKGHQLSSDAPVTTPKPYPQVHYLDKDWNLVSVSKGDNKRKMSDSQPPKSATPTIVGPHSLGDHGLVVTNTVPCSHGLESDMQTRHSSRRSSHQLREDATTPVRTPRSGSSHQLWSDPMTEETRIAIKHDLSAHRLTELSHVDHSHRIDGDMVVDTGGRVVEKHDIDSHEMIKSRAGQAPHRLLDDGTTASSSNARSAHALKTDETVALGQRAPGHHAV